MSAPNRASQPETLSQIERAIAIIEETPKGGEWLERLTVETAPLIREWDIAAAWTFKEWPGREKHDYSLKDFGIDVVAERHDGSLVAIQCKSRAEGGSITYSEMANFITASTPEHWTERWLIVNRNASPNKEARQELERIKTRPLKSDSLHECLVTERNALREALRPKQECPHCNDPDNIQTKDCMQAEVVDACVSKLRENQALDGDGIPRGEARGRLILPCGTGKTRISLRIVERLATNMGDVSAVLCPSIALVAQIRAEYIRNHHDGRINTLSVCSDQAAGDPVSNEERHASNPNPTDDSGLLPVSALKGLVTTDPEAIGDWLDEARAHNGLNVIFATYQSAHCIATALRNTHTRLQVLVCDEAHRTAGIMRPRRGEDESALRNFTICHDAERFPANYRLYQTATPRIYDHDSKRRASEQDLYVRDMDDQATFGVLLKRLSFADAVRNGWLSDYRIIAIADSDEDTLAQANQLASALKTFKGRKPKLGVPDLQKGLAFALAMGQAVRVGREDEPEAAIESCIAFLNTVANSIAMRKALTDPSTVEWLNKRLDDESTERRFVEYSMEHLDASSPLTERKAAKANLANGTPELPHAVFNVGIFGEGTDSPSLSAVAFLEPRRSAIDVVQAVGRAMRKAPGKERGYIIVPIRVPSDRPAEEWLMTSSPDDGWQELGQVLQALRAHDKRIEDELPQKLRLALPATDGKATTLSGVKLPGEENVTKFVHKGLASEANDIAAQLATGAAAPDQVEAVPIRGVADLDKRNLAPTRLITAQVRPGATKPEMRINNVDPKINDRNLTSDKRNKAMRDTIGDTINRKPGKDGRHLPDAAEQARAAQRQESFFDNPQFKAFADGIQMNLLSKSGIGETKVERDANILIDKVRKAAAYLRRDGLKADLDAHFGLDRLATKDKGDSTNVAGLILLNAAMLHQRIADGAWLDGIRPLTDICAAADPVSEFQNEWARIRGWDFEAIIGPASEIVQTLHRTGKTAGLAQALRSVAESASEIAAIYADMGTDHAGKVYNQFMADQASDGAYFTRPAAATLLAKLALDVCGDGVRWGKNNRIVDLACGSGTLLAAAMADIKARQDKGLTAKGTADLQSRLVQDCLVGLDVNPISLQLAAAQLTGSTHDIRYRRMNLCHMPYGPQPNGPVRGGSIELFAAEQITPPASDMDFRETLGGNDVWTLGQKVEDAAELVDGAKLVLMNPPYSNRSKMGEKFTKEDKARLRNRIDELYMFLGDGDMAGFDVRNSLHPMFVALADACLSDGGVMAFVCPTIALTSPSGLEERLALARNYHVHTILVSNHANNRNMSQSTGIDEAMVVLVKQTGSETVSRPTRVVVIDRFPTDEEETAELHGEIVKLETGGKLPDGYGEVSWWPADRIIEGNWAPTTLHSPELREAALAYADGYSGKLQPLAPEYWSGISGGGGGHPLGKQGRASMAIRTEGFRTSLEGRFVPKTTKQELNRHYSRNME